eukprot:2803840-Amphidinium_carterae.1
MVDIGTVWTATSVVVVETHAGKVDGGGGWEGSGSGDRTCANPLGFSLVGFAGVTAIIEYYRVGVLLACRACMDWTSVFAHVTAIAAFFKADSTFLGVFATTVEAPSQGPAGLHALRRSVMCWIVGCSLGAGDWVADWAGCCVFNFVQEKQGQLVRCQGSIDDDAIQVTIDHLMNKWESQ